MAEENDAEGEEEQSSEGEQKKSKLPIIIIAAVVLLGGGGGAFMFMGGGEEAKPAGAGEQAAGSEAAGENAEKPPEEGGGEEAKSEGEGEAEAAEGETAEEPQAEGAEAANQNDDNDDEERYFDFGQTIKLKPFNMNLGNPLENRYARMEVAIEFRGGDPQAKEIEARIPQIRDAVINITSRKTMEFLLGPDGKDQLRLELLNQINQYMEKKIEAVYITDMLIE